MTNVVFVPGSFDQMGGPVQVPPQGIYEISDEKLARLGTRIEVGERSFRYCQASEALSKGKLVTALGLVNTEATVTVAHAIGTFAVTITEENTRAITANMFADGMLTVTGGTGAGDSYRIRSHPAITQNTTGVFTLLDPLRTAWVIANTDVTITQSKYRVQEGNTDQLAIPVGVPLVDVTDEYYFWAQVSGPCATLADEAFGVGLDEKLVSCGSATAGAVEQWAAGEFIIGQVIPLADLVDAEYVLVELQLN